MAMMCRSIKQWHRVIGQADDVQANSLSLQTEAIGAQLVRVFLFSSV